MGCGVSKCVSLGCTHCMLKRFCTCSDILYIVKGLLKPSLFNVTNIRSHYSKHVAPKIDLSYPEASEFGQDQGDKTGVRLYSVCGGLNSLTP